MRTSHLRAGRPYNNKRSRLSSVDGHSLSVEQRGKGLEHAGRLEKGESLWGAARPTFVPHPSMSTFLQSLMKVSKQCVLNDCMGCYGGKSLKMVVHTNRKFRLKN